MIREVWVICGCSYFICGLVKRYECIIQGFKRSEEDEGSNAGYWYGL